MKKIISFLASASLLLALAPIAATAQGNGYTDCEQDPVYERDFSAKATTGANMRQRACMTDSAVVGTLASGETVQVIAETDGWYKIKTSAGKTAWVGSRLLSKTSEDASTGQKVSTDSAYETSSDETVTNRVKGYILLQVESVGEAWYVNPEDGNKYYMKDGDTAFEMMRSFGLGVSNSDFEKLLDGDKSLLAKLKGKIIILPEKNGEAYYIYPVTGKGYYLKNGGEAYKIMSQLGLGVKNKDLNKIQTKNKVEKTAENAKKTAKETANASGQVNSITLETSGDKNLEWTLDGYSEKGFKLVWSKNENPAYPTRSGDKYVYYSSPDARSGEISAFSGTGTYYVRVCEYLGGECGTYSNQLAVSLTAAEEEDNSAAVNSITVSGTGANIAWTIDGYSEQGFKVVWSKNENPTYPTRSGDQYHYYSETNKRSDTLSAFDGAGTYYVRVCEYLGGKCGVYSNQISVELE